MPEANATDLVTCQARREEHSDKKKEKTPQHGKSISRIYEEVVEKRVDELREKKGELSSRDVRQRVGARFPRGFRTNSGSTIPLGVAI
jgi:hypothetical protein